MTAFDGPCWPLFAQWPMDQRQPPTVLEEWGGFEVQGTGEEWGWYGQMRSEEWHGHMRRSDMDRWGGVRSDMDIWGVTWTYEEWHGQMRRNYSNAERKKNSIQLLRLITSWVTNLQMNLHLSKLLRQMRKILQILYGQRGHRPGTQGRRSKVFKRPIDFTSSNTMPILDKCPVHKSPPSY